MGLFRKAETARVGLKVLGYGDSGVGKSTFALTFPKIAAIDSESGMAHYENNANLVFIANTSSCYDVEDAITEIEDTLNKKKDSIETFCIDSETKIYDNMQVAAMETEEKRAKKKGQDVEDSTVSVRGWGRIKLLNKRLQNLKIDLSSKGINIVSVAQSEEIKEKRGENFVVVGKKPNMAKGIQFDYDIVLQLFTEKDMNGIEIYKALVEKDRTGVYHKGDIIENPSYDNWKSYVEANAELHERPVTFNKDTDKDMKKMETESEKLDEVIATFKEKMKGLAKENQVKVAKKIKELGIENPLKTDNLDGMIEVIDFIEKL